MNHYIYWKPPLYSSILKILTNPMYAGAYAFGRREVRTRVQAGRPYRTEGHIKARDQWLVLLRDHHPGYISWKQFECNENMLAENAYMKSRMGRPRGRGGPSLLVGLLRCRRCARKLRVHYLGKGRREMRYLCINGHINQGTAKCISFGGKRVDEVVSAEILNIIQPNAIQAALQAAEKAQRQQSERVRTLELELEQMRYEARLAARRYEAVDPDNRLVASELEARWNVTLSKVQEVEKRLEQVRSETSATSPVNVDELIRLAEDLPAVWALPTSDTSLKQRILRIVIEEIIADVDEQAQEIVLIIHWVGGRHTEIRVPKLKTGQHSRCTQVEVVDIVRQMATVYRDDDIAHTLNRLRLRTGAGNTWNEGRVRALRSHLKLPAYQPNQREGQLNLQQAANQLGVSATVVRRLIESKTLPAKQIVPGAPWQIEARDVESAEVVQAAMALKTRESSSSRQPADESTLRLPGL